MDEIWPRAGVVIGILAIAAVFTWIQRRDLRSRVRTIESTGLAPGVYFFSSSTCSNCDVAREKLDSALGDAGYIEIPWEDEPGRFEDLEVEAVPAVLIVGNGGEGRVYPGQPDSALRRL